MSKEVGYSYLSNPIHEGLGITTFCLDIKAVSLILKGDSHATVGLRTVKRW